MEVDNHDNVVDIINCVALYYEKGASGNAFLRRGKFRATASRQSLKRNSPVSRPEFKSSRELKRSLSFNELNILVLYLEYQWTLCHALRWSSRVATLDGEANLLLGRVSAFVSAIQFHSRFMFS